MLAITPLREEFVIEKGSALGGTAKDIEFSGPYVLKEWVYEGYLLLEKNPKYIYSRESFPVGTIEILVGVDSNTRVAMFENGEVDVVKSVSRQNLDLISEYIVRFPAGMQQAIQFNPYGKGNNEENGKLIANLSFRKALSYALDRETIVAGVNPLYDPNTRLISNLFLDSNYNESFISSYPIETVSKSGNIDLAKFYLNEALKELGYDNVNDLPQLSYLTFDVQDYVILAETFINQWEQILGLRNISINNLPVPLAIQAMIGYDYDMYYTSLSSGSDPSYVLNMWITGGTINDIQGTGKNLWSNSKYDDLLQKSFLEFDLDKRYELLVQAEQIIINEGPLVPFMTGNITSAIQPWVEGYVFNSLDQGFSLNKLSIKR
jgi:ABC-type oligopeptide transport system substrate-binding subunit